MGCKRIRWYVESFNMGSIQQVAMAAVCLAAAFAFGSFINQAPEHESNQTAVEWSDHPRSLIEPNLTVQKSPAKTPWMKPRLTARLPMPVLTNDAPFASQTANTLGQRSSDIGEIPPPSDLTGRTGFSTNKSLISPEPTGLVANAPTFGSEDFAEPSMPTVNSQIFSSSPNLADSMRSPVRPDFEDQSPSAVENAPVFAVPEYANAETLPTSQSFQAETYIASKPRLPNHSMRPIEPAPRRAPRPRAITPPEMPFETAANTRNPFGRSFNNATETNGREEENENLMPIPRFNQTVAIIDPGGAFGNRDTQGQWGQASKSVMENDASDYYPEANRHRPQQQQQRVARLPFQLNSDAKTKLTRLRDHTIQKISLSTTQFSEHVVEQGDSLQSIATEYFGKPDFYLDIYLANRDRLRYPGDIREGMTIKIPVYQ